MIPKVTLLELVAVVTDYSEDEAEVLATVVHLVNSGRVELIGNFRGCAFALGDDSVFAAA